MPDYDESIITTGNWNLVRQRDFSRKEIVLCPTLYYPGEHTLGVDYIRIYDEKSIDENEANAIAASLSQYQNLAGYDEPFQPEYVMHKNIQWALGRNKNLFQSVTNRNMSSAWDENGNSLKKAIHLQSNTFAREADPKYILSQLYSINTIRQWNTVQENNYSSLQISLDRFNEYYKYSREYIDDLNNLSHHDISDRKFIPVIQSYGEYRRQNGFLKWTNVMQPPKTIQKVLAYLPLCYDADGIIYFDFTSMQSGEPDANGVFGCKGLLNRHKNGDPILPSVPEGEIYTSSSYDNVKDANFKILKFAEILKPLNWNKDCIKTLHSQNQEISNIIQTVQASAYDPSGLENHDDIYEEGYDGYVECATYDDGSNNYYFLVNRRAEFAKRTITDQFGNLDLVWDNNLKVSLYSNLDVVNPDSTNFEKADPQVVAFSSYNGQLALVDLLTYEIYNVSLNNELPREMSNIPIEAGEARLLKLFTKVDPVVTSNTTVSNTYINSNVVVNSGATLTLGGNNRIYNNAIITVNQGGKLILTQNSNNILKSGVKINVYGELQIINSQISGDGDKWNSIYCYDNAVLNILNSNIKDSQIGIIVQNATANISNSQFSNCYNQVLRLRNGSTVQISQSEFNIYGGLQAIYIDDQSGYNRSKVKLTGTLANPSRIFSRSKSGTGINISYNTGNNYTTRYLKCENVMFDNLNYAIKKLSSYADNDTILSCSFYDNQTAIDYTRSGFSTIKSSLISLNTFENNTLAIVLNNNNVLINQNMFLDNTTAVEMMYSNANTIVSSNEFNGNVTAVRAVNSVPKVQFNTFLEDNDVALSLANNSVVNASVNSNNVFKAFRKQIEFKEYNASAFSANIDLYNGHNDFYGSTLNWDFWFSSLFSPTYRSINVSGNYWANNQVNFLFNGTGTVNFINSYYDTTPNVQNNQNSVGSPQSRYEQALVVQETNQSYAKSLYQSIVLDQNANELDDVNLALNQFTQIALADSNSYNPALEIMDAVVDSSLINNDEVIHQQVCSSVNNQKKKIYLAQENYENALNILTDQYLNSSNPVDSLMTLMEIELVSLLADLSGQKSAINYKIAHLKPKDFSVLSMNKEKYWKEIDRSLYQQSDSIEIPDKEMLYRNYPNPFNPSTVIEFSVPKTSRVEVSIYNVKGQKIKKLCSTQYTKGKYQLIWNGNDDFNKSVSSGIYFYQLKVNDQLIQTRKCMLLK